MKTGNLTGSCVAWLAGLAAVVYFCADPVDAYNYNYGSLLNSQHAKDADTKVPTLHTSIKAEDFKNNPEIYRRSSKIDENNPELNRRSTQTDEDVKLCPKVCLFCRSVLSMRWAALCFVQCQQQGGRAFQACMTVYSIRGEFENDKKTNA